MINVNNQNKMQRHEQIIELSDHVKNKLKQHQHPTLTSPFIDSYDEFIEVDSTDDDNESLLVTSPDNVNRTRRDTFTTYRVKQSTQSFFTDGRPDQNTSVSVLQEQFVKQQQQQCQECIQRDHLLYVERQRLVHLYDDNRQLHEQLRSSVLLNRQYENDIHKLKHHLRKMNSHLYEYHINFDQLKQKIESEKKTSEKIDEEDKDDEEDKQATTMEHLKRLRYEVYMYNRRVAANQKQEQKRH